MWDYFAEGVAKTSNDLNEDEDPSISSGPGQGDDAPHPKVGDMVDAWDVVSVYTAEQAEADGVLVKVGRLVESGDAVYFTANLLAQGYGDDEARRTELIQRGLPVLRQPSDEDTSDMRLRIVERDKTWVVQEHGKLTFMKPEDY